MMRRNKQGMRNGAGVSSPFAGVLSPQLVAAGIACALFATACGSQEQDRNLPTEQVGLTPDVAPVFDDGETQLFEVKRGLRFPILQPDDQARAALGKEAVEPYGRTPWITNKDVKVQLTWTLSNLDDEERVVELLVDPWNEFGRYYPGMSLTNAEEQEFQPNSSGIDHYYVLSPKSTGDASRRHGTFTFDDMNEMAVDFATVQAMIKNPPPLPNGVETDPDMMTDPLPVYANHAFNFLNHSYNDLLVKPYIPQVIAGLTGIDFGFRTTVKATVALDIQIEIVDLGQQRVQTEGSSATLLPATTEVVTVGAALPSAM
jgi:hypothetical protein